MFRSAALVVVLGCTIRVVTSVPTPLSTPEVLATASMLAWLLWGPAWGIAVTTTAWSVLNVGWVLDERLDPALAGQDIIVTGTICDFPRDDGRAQRFVLRVARAPTDPGLPPTIYLSSYGALAGELVAGQRWRLKVRLKRPRGLSNPGAFDFERWALERRIGATGYVRKSAVNQPLAGAAGDCPSMRWRQFLANAIARTVEPRAAGRFLPAIAVGARERLTQADWTLLRRTGTTHLMAISGLHIGLVAALMLWVGRGLAAVLLAAGHNFSPLSLGRLFAVGGATVYAAMAGFSVPTTRALVMVGVGVMLATARREIEAWQILGAAAIAVLWVDPFALLGSGFWLSFGAVALLLLATLALPLGPTPPGAIVTRLRRVVRAQLSLSVGLAPLALLFFAEVSLVSPLTNLVAVPVFAFLIVPLTLLGALALPVAPPAAGALLGGAAVLLDAGLFLLTKLAAWPGASWRDAMPGGVWAVAACAGALVMCWPRPLRGRWLGATPMLAIVFGLSSGAAPSLRVVVMDAGQGLAVLVQTPDHALLYDAGPAFGARDAGQTVVLPVLRHFGVSGLDAVLVSHGDSDHAGGARTVLDAHPDAALIATERFGLAARAIVTCAAGLRWNWDGVHFRILHPAGASGTRLSGDNDRSCVLSVTTASSSLLLPGDIESRAESQLAGGGLDRHDVVVAPHHGSATSSSRPFIAAVSPRIVVFATGFANRWGFPAEEVRERWRAGGACLLDTAFTGALVFEANDGERLRLVALHRSEARRAWTDGEPPASACE